MAVLLQAIRVCLCNNNNNHNYNRSCRPYRRPPHPPSTTRTEAAATITRMCGLKNVAVDSMQWEAHRLLLVMPDIPSIITFVVDCWGRVVLPRCICAPPLIRASIMPSKSSPKPTLSKPGPDKRCVAGGGPFPHLLCASKHNFLDDTYIFLILTVFYFFLLLLLPVASRDQNPSHVEASARVRIQTFL